MRNDPLSTTMNNRSPSRAWVFHTRVQPGHADPVRDSTALRVKAYGCHILVCVLVCSAVVFAGGGWTDASAQETVRFAVIGDYGFAGEPESDVADLVIGWDPDVIITTGDNNYEFGEASTIDINIGQFYHEYISPYAGSFGAGSPSGNRFFPSLGNHDWESPNAQPYLDYFALPGNERYYAFMSGPVHFFVIDSDSREPDGVTSDSAQAQWLRDGLQASTAPWKLVYFHHPPYSSGSTHGSHPYMQWPFQEWGASAVLTGHEHNYERLLISNFPYFVVGLGGRSIYEFGAPIPGSVVRYNEDFGAMLVDADASAMTFRFYSRFGALVDSYTLLADVLPRVTLIEASASWKVLDDGSDQGTAWQRVDFDDTSWPSGHAELGYGDGDETTLVSFGPDPSAKYITTYFRRRFTVTNPSSLSNVRLELLRDDGAVVYLNGTEIFRSNMPNTSDFSTLALVAIGGSEEQVWHATAVNPSLLSSGTNLIAVEVHQADPASSDISFNLTLTGVEN
jgi:tartrate-resistant acid phosphatase type 5